MLEYDFQFKKGILFIRLKGSINKISSKLIVEEIDPLILDNGIKKIVFNSYGVNDIDNYGVNVFLESYEMLKKQSDVVLCSIPSKIHKKVENLLKIITEREDEFTILEKN